MSSFPRPGISGLRGPSAEGKTRKPQAASRPHPSRDDFAHALVSETLDLTWALMALTMHELEPEVIDDTFGIMLKYQTTLDRCAHC